MPRPAQGRGRAGSVVSPGDNFHAALNSGTPYGSSHPRRPPMRLADYTDYTLRVLMYCAANRTAWSPSRRWRGATASPRTT